VSLSPLCQENHTESDLQSGKSGKCHDWDFEDNGKAGDWVADDVTEIKIVDANKTRLYFVIKSEAIGSG